MDNPINEPRTGITTLLQRVSSIHACWRLVITFSWRRTLVLLHAFLSSSADQWPFLLVPEYVAIYKYISNNNSTGNSNHISSYVGSTFTWNKTLVFLLFHILWLNSIDAHLFSLRTFVVLYWRTKKHCNELEISIDIMWIIFTCI